MSQHISDKKWDRIMDGMNRRDFIMSSLAAGALTLTPRFVGAQAGKTYKLGVLLPSTGTGAKKAMRAATGPAFRRLGMSMPIDGAARTSG